MTKSPALIGHRGARGLFPENTLEGFAAAAALGLDGIELDVVLTADGVPVVCHDPALNPALAPPIRRLPRSKRSSIGGAHPGGRRTAR